MKLEGNASSHHFRDAVYVGVVVAGAELGVSERRVRQLCEQHQLDGAILVNGGWLIPLPILKLKGEPCTDHNQATEPHPSSTTASKTDATS